jgi:anti-sigma regulatory factor (Ser/Thr protein kinase)
MVQRGASAQPQAGAGPASGTSEARLRHHALAYRGSAECLAATAPFATDGLARGEAVLAGVGPAAAGLLRDKLGGDWQRVVCFDMTDLGRNPGRIIAAMWDFARQHADRPVRFLSEPFWPGRPVAEVAEAARHEALLNLAFAGMAVTALCLYDAVALDPSVLSRAGETHPVVISGGRPRTSSRFAAATNPADYERSLAPPPADARSLSYLEDLRPVRKLVSDQASRAGLAPGRIADLVLAVGEAVANTLRHARGRGTLQVWQTRDEVICQVSDRGHIADPLAGRRRPSAVTSSAVTSGAVTSGAATSGAVTSGAVTSGPATPSPATPSPVTTGGAATSGHGLWVVHQVCDLVEQRTSPHGTVLRLHVRR